MVIDNNDNAPFFKVKNYITVIEEGATKFEPSFFVKVSDWFHFLKLCITLKI